MPDGKRSSLPPEGETEGVNCFYNDEDIQNSNNATKRLPLNLNTRGYHTLNERLLKAMVANIDEFMQSGLSLKSIMLFQEIKKTLDMEDNKKLVAHHRPVLHPENEINESDMVVVGVVLNAKQSQNDEVSKAIEMLRRNGVSCVYFTIKDQPGGNGVKKDDAATTTSFESDQLVEESPTDKSEQDENIIQSGILDTEKKVSSPTVSTTSDYNSPRDDVIDCPDTSCTSTTSPKLTTIDIVEGPSEKELSSQSAKKVCLDTFSRNVEAQTIAEDTIDNEPQSLPPSPPLLFPQEPTTDCKEDQKDTETGEALVGKPKRKVNTSSTNRRKRRKRMYPYVSRRKSRNKKRKMTLAPEIEADLPDTINEVGTLIETETKLRAPSPTVLELLQIQQEEKEIKCPSVEKKPKRLSTKTRMISPPSPVDPYKFEESDSESAAIKTASFKTPSISSRKIQKVTIPKKTTSGQKVKTSFVSPPACPKGGKRSAKKRRAKGSPRKRLTFSKTRAISPDITESVNFSSSRRALEGKKSAKEETQISPKELLCVQPISKEKDIKVEVEKSDKDRLNIASVPTDGILKDVKLVPDTNGQCCDADIRAKEIDTNDPEVRTCDNATTTFKKDPSDPAQVPSDVQTRVPKENSSEGIQEPVGFLVPAPPNDSLQDAPDSMQLRRSSFYSSISRNVKTNLEKYLDGRSQDLKAPKRSKKVKNGFLLHHGDNFPDDPEAPYRLHLATQVLLKLNKRRVKFKPKEDKGKSLLSYLKLQPKRVSRVGKHSKPTTEEVDSSSATEPTTSVFSGEWTVPRKFICNICGQVENAFWDMVMHKGEVHPGIVVTHVELSDYPPEGFRKPPSPRTSTTIPNPPSCSKCSIQLNSYDELHRHIFECAGNATVLEEPTAPKVVPRKKKGKRKRGFKRRITSAPKKNADIPVKNPVSAVVKSGEITKRRNSEVFKCELCAREFKTEGWLKNHSLSHSLPVSIPLDKLSLPTRASLNSSRRITTHLLAKPSKQLSRET